MADFQSGVTPVDPANVGGGVRPVDTSTAQAISSLGGIAAGLGQTAMNAYQAGQQQQQTNKTNAFTADLQERLLRIADAHQQGSISTDQALRQGRLLYAQAVASNPNAQKDIFTAYSNVMTSAGLGLGIAKAYDQEQTDANQQRQAAIMDAQKAGFVNPGMSPAETNAGVNQYQQYTFAATKLAVAQKQFDMEKTQAELQAAKASTANSQLSYARNVYEFNQLRQKQNVLNASKDISAVFFNKFQGDLGNVAKGVASGSIKAEDAISNIDSQLAVIEQQAAQAGASTGQSDVMLALMKPLQNLAQAYKDRLSGKTTNDVLNLQIKNIGLHNQQNVLSASPEVARLSAISTLFPTGMTALQTGLVNEAVGVMKRQNIVDANGNPMPPEQWNKPADLTNNKDPDHNTGVDQYMTMVNAGVKAVRSGDNNPKLVAETSGHIQQMLGSFGMYGNTVSSPTELKSFIKFFSNPDVGSYLKDHRDVVRGDAAKGATSAYHHAYDSVVLPLVQEDLLTKKVAVTDEYNNTSMEDAEKNISMSFNGANVVFTPKVKSPDVVSTATRLNRELAPVITNMVRVRAHLSGSTDYKKYFGGLQQEIFGSPSGEVNEDSTN